MEGSMKELLTYIARNLVEHPDSVTVTEYAGADETVLELRVAPGQVQPAGPFWQPLVP